MRILTAFVKCSLFDFLILRIPDRATEIYLKTKTWPLIVLLMARMTCSHTHALDGKLSPRMLGWLRAKDGKMQASFNRRGEGSFELLLPSQVGKFNTSSSLCNCFIVQCGSAECRSMFFDNPIAVGK